jgi:Glycosyltransferase family 87
MRPIRLTPIGSVQLPEAGADDRRDQPADPVTRKDRTAWLSADTVFGGRWLASRRARNVVYTVLFLELGLLIGFAVVYRPFDLGIYLWGGRAVLHGLRLYQVQVKANWYTYPPFAAALSTPLTALPSVIVGLAWELGSFAALAWGCVLTLRLAGYRPERMVVLAVLAGAFVLEPMYHTLYLGQVNIFLFTLVLIDVWRVSQGRTAGIGVGISAAIKLVPGIFVLFFLVTKRWKDAAVASLTFAVCAAIGYLVDPSASRLYWTRLFYDTKRVPISYISNQSVYSGITRIVGGVGHVGLWLDVISVILGAAGLVLAATLVRRDDWLAATAVTGITGLLVSPVAWTHHWVWALPALVVVMRGGRAARIGAACGYVLFVLAPNWFTPHTHEDGQFGFHWIVTLVANCFTLAGLVFLCYVAVRTYLPRGREADQGYGRANAHNRRRVTTWTRIDGRAQHVPLDIRGLARRASAEPTDTAGAAPGDSASAELAGQADAELAGRADGGP